MSCRDKTCSGKCRTALAILVPLIALALHGRASAKEGKMPQELVEIVTAGESHWQIVVRAEASAPERLAARELARYVQQITGAGLPVVDRPTPGHATIRIDCDEGDWDGFDLSVAPDGILIRGHTPRGALYGAYQLLEEMGCRWFYIGELGEVVPAAPDIHLPAGSTTQHASFRERSVLVAYPSYYERFEEWIDFLTKMRINNIGIYGQSVEWWEANRDQYMPMLTERQVILEFGGHIMPSFVPRDLFDQHPDYFRMNEEGARTNDHNICPASDAIRMLRANARRHFQRLPEVMYFHVWADDLIGGGWCHCPECAGLSPADQNIIAMNAMAAELAEVNPEASLALLAYHDTGEVPGIAPARNLFLYHAPRERCFAHAFDSATCRRNREEYMPSWLALRAVFMETAPDTVHEFNYYTDGLLNREMQPPQVETIPADARYFCDSGVQVHQNLMVCFRGWHSPPFSLVLSSRAAWDADVSGRDTLDDFCRHYYGEANARLMKEYYRDVEEACQALFVSDSVEGPYIDMCWPPMDPVVRESKIADARRAVAKHRGLQERLESALAHTPGGLFQERLRRERDVCELHHALIELALCQFEGQYLGWQYVNGSVNREDGQRAADLLAEGVVWVARVTEWIERFPEEQDGLLGGWKSYWGSYAEVFQELDKRVRETLENEEPAE